MMIATLLMFPVQEEHQSMYKSGKPQWQESRANLGLVSCQLINSITEEAFNLKKQPFYHLF